MNNYFVASTLGDPLARKIYNTFDRSFGNLVDLYCEDALMTFEGHLCQGKEEILAKFNSLHLELSQHTINNVDSQPSGNGGGMVVQVLGQWDFTVSSHDQQILQFSETFHLKPTAEGGYGIKNDIFRFVNHIPPQNDDMEG